MLCAWCEVANTASRSVTFQTHVHQWGRHHGQENELTLPQTPLAPLRGPSLSFPPPPPPSLKGSATPPGFSEDGTTQH